VSDLPLGPVPTPSAVLELIGLDEVADMLAKPPRRRAEWHEQYPREDDCDGVGMAREVTPWGSRRIVRRADGLVVGSVGFFGPPEPADDGVPEVEIGYGLVEAARGQGLMREVLAALLGATDAAGVRVRAATTSDNAASLASLRGAGFAVVSEDPDDPERQVLLRRALTR
jgi:ribosomal-protein-alanine N-acetyltransferase